MKDRDKTKEQLISELVEIRATKDFLDNIIDTLLDSIIITDAKRCITRTNRSFLQMLDCEEEVISGKYLDELSPEKEGLYESTIGEFVEINKEFLDYKKTCMSKLVEEGKIFNMKNYYIRKDNKIVPVENSIVYLYNKRGDRIGTVAIIRDLTEIKKEEKKNRETRAFLETVFNAWTDGIMITDRIGCIVRINKTIEQMLGYREDELIGKYTIELGPEDEVHKTIRERMIGDLLEEGHVNNWETVWYRKDGSLCPVEINITFLKDPDGNVSGAVAVIRDVSGRNKMEHNG
jgi:PAS domain S-box-containing protein